MIGPGRVLAVVPARGGSKGVPRKNVRPLGGKPLLQWTVEAARGSRFIDRLVLSTDDDEIATVGRAIGIDVPFMRPAAAATDEATADAVIDHALSALDESFDYLVLLQPTSPFRTTADIDGCLELLAASDADSCVSVMPTHVKPEWLFFVDGSSFLVPVSGGPPPQRRQELRPAYELNGAVYAARLAAYRRTRTFYTDRTLAWVMPLERSVDLDEESDFGRAEALLRRA
jgi:N-acylneuraminate cytidylyltransferase